MLIEVVDNLIVLQSVCRFSFHCLGSTFLHHIDIFCFYCHFQVENWRIVISIFMPTSFNKAFFERTVFFANENASFFLQVVSFPVKIPVSDHWSSFQRFLLTFHESLRWSFNPLKFRNRFYFCKRSFLGRF